MDSEDFEIVFFVFSFFILGIVGIFVQTGKFILGKR